MMRRVEEMYFHSAQLGLEGSHGVLWHGAVEHIIEKDGVTVMERLK
jgi:hypothetical protein